MTWLLMRTGRFDEAESIAVAAMDVVEPRMRGGTPDEYATWGGLAMEAAAAAARNNRPAEAKELRTAATRAGKVLGKAHQNLLRHWSTLGPVTIAIKELEDSMIIGDARKVVRAAERDKVLQPAAWRHLGSPSSNDQNRYYLDLAGAYAQTGDPSAAMRELVQLDARAPEWFRHQTSAARTLEKIIAKQRILTTEMRTVGSHLGILS